jgi:hypothetical protein
LKQLVNIAWFALNFLLRASFCSGFVKIEISGLCMLESSRYAK